MTASPITLQPAWKSYFVFYVASIIFGLGPVFNPEAFLGRATGLLIAALLIAFVLVKRKNTFYRFSAAGVSKELRWGGQGQAKTIPWEDLASVTVRRGIVHRLIGVGQLQFQSKKTGAPDLWWYGVDRPFEIKRRIDAALDYGGTR
ncbi:MAG: hypothetical protein HY892_19960 [Deltaproteobacteria bacterium]|nr:hypothetical protein [Deltaproteobacteria bacterium]